MILLFENIQRIPVAREFSLGLWGALVALEDGREARVTRRVTQAVPREQRSGRPFLPTSPALQSWGMSGVQRVRWSAFPSTVRRRSWRWRMRTC